MLRLSALLLSPMYSKWKSGEKGDPFLSIDLSTTFLQILTQFSNQSTNTFILYETINIAKEN